MTPNKIRQLRKSLNMSQTEFSLELGLGKNHTTVSLMENGRYKPSKTLQKLLKTMDKS